jgi:hypothetical protein
LFELDDELQEVEEGFASDGDIGVGLAGGDGPSGLFEAGSEA